MFNHKPRHIAIIPDGNRRWAKKKGLPSFEGHRFAAENTLTELIEKVGQLEIEYFTFWALSTENLIKRKGQELTNLFNLIRVFLKQKLPQFKKKGVRLKFIGNLNALPEDIQQGIKKGVDATKTNSKTTLIVGLNYGGRDEILRAVKKLPDQNRRTKILNKDDFNKYLDTKDIPDPDLIIRTGGEKRLSGFMLWQSEYSELYFSDKMFPDFNGLELEKAVQEYSLSRDLLTDIASTQPPVLTHCCYRQKGK